MHNGRSLYVSLPPPQKKKNLTECDEICYCGHEKLQVILKMFHTGPLKAKLKSDVQSPVSGSSN